MGTPNTSCSELTPLVHALTFSQGILKIPYLSSFLGIEVISKKSPILSRLSRPVQREEPHSFTSFPTGATGKYPGERVCRSCGTWLGKQEKYGLAA
jgi:hypothetical protein